MRVLPNRGNRKEDGRERNPERANDREVRSIAREPPERGR